MTNKLRGRQRLSKTVAAASVAAALGLGLALTGAQAASAHDGGVEASCTGGLSVTLTKYPGNSTISGTIDGRAYPAVSFSGAYSDHITWEPTINHSYELTVVSSDNYPTKHFAESITNCVPAVPETPTPTSYVPVLPTPTTPSSTPTIPADKPVAGAPVAKATTSGTQELAFTGNEGLKGVGVIAIILIAAGIGIWLDRRHRLRKNR